MISDEDIVELYESIASVFLSALPSAIEVAVAEHLQITQARVREALDRVYGSSR